MTTRNGMRSLYLPFGKTRNTGTMMDMHGIADHSFSTEMLMKKW